jgi:DNA-binding transcriptional LysR family regulator
MQFSLTDLTLFVQVAETGSLTRAAERVHLSLAAASARVRALEEQAGLHLLYREARGVRLSAAGEAFAHHARRMLQQAERLRGDLREYSGGVKGHVRIFANTTAVTDFMPEVLARFLATHPNIFVDLQERANLDIVRGVRDGSTDIGIVAGEVETEGLQRIHFSTDRLLLVTPRGHKLARRKRVAFAETLAYDHVGLHEGSTIHSFLERIVEQMGSRLKLRIQLRGFDAMCRMIEAGVGVGIVPESAARRHAQNMALALVDLSDGWAVRERYIVVREVEQLPSFSRELVQSLRAAFATG